MNTFLGSGSSKRAPQSTRQTQNEDAVSPGMTVWILQTGEPLPLGGRQARPMRAMNLAEALTEAGHKVVLWSADFSHLEKRHAYGQDTKIQLSDRLELRLIHSLGYQKNVGFSRILDHLQLGLRLRKHLASEEPPDVAFVGFPPMEPAAVMIRWLH